MPTKEEPRGLLMSRGLLVFRGMWHAQGTMSNDQIFGKQQSGLIESMSGEVILLLLKICKSDAVQLVQRDLERAEHLRIAIVELKSQIAPFRTLPPQGRPLRRAYLISSSTARSVRRISARSFLARLAIFDIVKWGSENLIARLK
jgi:hypothetical protein